MEVIVSSTTYYENTTGFSLVIKGNEYSGDYIERGENGISEFTQEIVWEGEEPNEDHYDFQDLCDNISSELQNK